MNNYGAKSSSGYRFTLLDGGLLLAIASLIGWLYYRSEVGIHYQWHWREAWTLIFTPRADGSLPYFLQGLGATLRLSLWGMVLALVLGSLIGIARSQKAWFVRLPANAFVQLVRNIPPLVFVFIFYFFISNQLIPLLGLDELLRYHTAEVHPLITWLFGPARLWENLLSGVLCIGLLSSAYIAEIVRAGLANIPQGQWEAADSLGLPTWGKYRYVIAPQVLTAITPALLGRQYPSSKTRRSSR